MKKKENERGRIWFKPAFKTLLTMKLIFLLVCGLGLLTSVAEKSYAQSTKLTVNLKNTSVKDVLEHIENNSEFSFMYENNIIDLDNKVDFAIEDETIDVVLSQLLDDNIEYRVIGRHIVLFAAGQKTEEIKHLQNQQQSYVSGRISDSSGLPLPGVSVIVKGTTQGTVSNTDGEYALQNIPQNAVLVFSFIGMRTQEVEVGNQTIIDVRMIEETIGMDEVIVVGYGTQRRANLTGAIGQINADEIAARPSPNITTALQGLMPGLNVKSNTGNPRIAPEINLRGFNSLNGGSPLVLVDGIEGQLELINPSDIESVTVLKDAASSAIYGARGSFGVVLVTTKKGEEGDIRINYNNYFGLSTQTNRTDYISDPYLHGKTVDAGIYGYNGSSFTNYNEEDWETIQKVASGEIEPFYETLPNGTKKFFYKTDWYNYLFKKWVPSENHNISLSGGSEKINGYLSGRYYKTDDINNIATGNLIKYNLKGTLNFQVTEWLKVSGNIQYNTHDEIEYGGTNNGWRDVNSASSWLGLYSWEPNFIDGVPFHNTGVGTFASMEARKSFRTRYLEQLINSFNVILNPIKDLEINFDYSRRINHRDVATRLNKFEFYRGPRIDLTTQGLNRLSESREKNYYNALNIYSTYSKNFSDNHSFKIMLGYNQEDYISDNILGSHENLLYPDLSNFNLGTSILELTGSANNWAIQGYFGRLNYDYKNRYLVEVNARMDGSSRFPDYSRWGFFPSASVGWYVSRESFWTPLENAINSLKLRASYGQLGNQNIGLYTFSQTLNPSLTSWLFNGSNQNYVGVPSPLPRVVTWEETTTIDVGADFGFFKNKLQASFDWYEKRTEGMYVSGQPLPSVFGASEPRENIAGLSNRGFELSLSFNEQFEVKGDPLNLRTTLSISNYEAKINKFPNPEGVMSSYWEGQRLGDIWGYRVDGQFQSDEEAQEYQNSFENQTHSLGQVYNFIINLAQNSEWKGLRAGDIKYLDTDGDGEISRGNYTLEDHGDLEVIGNAMPRFPFGFSANANWRGFDLSVAGAGVMRQDWAPGGVPYWGHYDRPQASFIRKDLIENAWSPENPGGKFPQIFRGYTALGSSRMLFAPNDYYLENVGYLKVKNLTFGYTFPRTLTEKINIQNLRIYFSGENLFTWRFGGLTRYVDPEQAGSGIGFNDPGDATGRSLLEEYPYGRVYSLGINITL